MGIIGAVTQLLVSLLVPLGLVWYGRKKGGFRGKRSASGH